MSLDEALIDLGGTGETDARAMAGQQRQALLFGQVWSDDTRAISTKRRPVLASRLSCAPSSKVSTQSPVSGASSLPTSRPTISERRNPPAYPSCRIARSRRPRRSKPRVATMVRMSTGGIVSFCTGGLACLCLMPASTLAEWRFLRSRVKPRCACSGQGPTGGA